MRDLPKELKARAESVRWAPTEGTPVSVRLGLKSESMSVRACLCLSVCDLSVCVYVHARSLVCTLQGCARECTVAVWLTSPRSHADKQTGSADTALSLTDPTPRESQIQALWSRERSTVSSCGAHTRELTILSPTREGTHIRWLSLHTSHSPTRHPHGSHSPDPTPREITKTGTVEPGEEYNHFLRYTRELVSNKLDATAFEDLMRDMYGSQAYVSLTIDKLLHALGRSVCVVCLSFCFGLFHCL